MPKQLSLFKRLSHGLVWWLFGTAAVMGLTANARRNDEDMHAFVTRVNDGNYDHHDLFDLGHHYLKEAMAAKNDDVKFYEGTKQGVEYLGQLIQDYTKETLPRFGNKIGYMFDRDLKGILYESEILLLAYDIGMSYGQNFATQGPSYLRKTQEYAYLFHDTPDEPLDVIFDVIDMMATMEAIRQQQKYYDSRDDAHILRANDEETMALSKEVIAKFFKAMGEYGPKNSQSEIELMFNNVGQILTYLILDGFRTFNENNKHEAASPERGSLLSRLGGSPMGAFTGAFTMGVYLWAPKIYRWFLERRVKANLNLEIKKFEKPKKKEKNEPAATVVELKKETEEEIMAKNIKAQAEQEKQENDKAQRLAQMQIASELDRKQKKIFDAKFRELLTTHTSDLKSFKIKNNFILSQVKHHSEYFVKLTEILDEPKLMLDILHAAGISSKTHKNIYDKIMGNQKPLVIPEPEEEILVQPIDVINEPVANPIVRTYKKEKQPAGFSINLNNRPSTELHDRLLELKHEFLLRCHMINELYKLAPDKTQKLLNYHELMVIRHGLLHIDLTYEKISDIERIGLYQGAVQKLRDIGDIYTIEQADQRLLTFPKQLRFESAHPMYQSFDVNHVAWEIDHAKNMNSNDEFCMGMIEARFVRLQEPSLSNVIKEMLMVEIGELFQQLRNAGFENAFTDPRSQAAIDVRNQIAHQGKIQSADHVAGPSRRIN